jgi:glycosyltransferase involved in cell wall biosynthesis
MRILIVSEYFYPSDNSTAYYITEISRALSSVGNVTVLCNTELGSNSEVAFLVNEVIRVKGGTINKSSLMSRIIHFIITTLRLSWKLLTCVDRGSSVFAVTNPAFLIIFLALIKKIKKFNFTLLAYDIFPENALAAGILKKKGLVYNIAKMVFDWAYMQADHIVVIGRDMEQVIGEKTRYCVPMTLITNWCDTGRVQALPKEENEIVRRLGLEDKVVFSFVGNLGRVQGIKNLLDAATRVQNRDFILLFIGDGTMRPIIEAYISNTPSGNVMYAGSYPASEENIFLNACDVALISLSPDMYGLGVPSKSYHNMAAGKPILLVGDQDSEIGRVINENGIGWITSPNDAAVLAAQFEKICVDKSLKDKGRKSRSIIEKLYSKEVVLTKYKKLYESIN